MPDMINRQTDKYEPLTFDAIRIGLASPEKIREWSHGEVKKPETINYRTLKPEPDGLFCERIFGPTKDWECHCGKYKKIRYKGVICDKCGVEVTKASVRRERMGHIELAAPVSHIWYFKGIPSRMGLILDLSPRILERVLYFAAYIVLDPGETDLEYKQILTEQEYQNAREQYGYKFRVGMGAEAIKELLQSIDLDRESEELRSELESATGQKRARIVKRLEVVEAFRESGNEPAWMVLDCMPVIPPDLRPMVQLDGGRFATSDLNDLYRRIINRNNRLQKLLELGTPDIIVRNEKRMLQEAVDALIDNGRRGRPVQGPGNRPLKSLSDMLKGKGGRFRQNLLGKRVDYSGRSVIVVGPELKIWQCGLPKEMAIELFKPFVMKELVSNGTSHNIKNAKKMVERLDPEVWDVLEKVIHEHPVMLNRAPTLHRLGIQSFEPVLVEGKAIKLHPLACTPFNADFDGDQMAVHLPLSVEAQAESRFLMLMPNNLLKPADGGPVNVPTQDMVLGCYYLTQEREGEPGEGKIFKSVSEAILAHENGIITLHSKIGVQVVRKIDKKTYSGVVNSTLGRFLFNEIVPQDLGFVDRSVKGNELALEIDFLVGKKGLKKIITKVLNAHGAIKTAEVLDHIKDMGYHYSTIAAMSVSISDMTVPSQKQELLDKAQDKVDMISRNFKRGLITDAERYKEVIDTWKDTDEELTKDLLDGLDRYNNIYMMADSGARGSDQQIKQLAGMRGLMADTTGHTIELPIKSNFREGLNVLEYFMSAHGARKGLSDTALRTADSGYLTRRLVDVSQELTIREQDCSEDKDEIPGMIVKAFYDDESKSRDEDKGVLESLQERITGRFSCEDIYDNKGNLIVKANRMITPRRAEQIVTVGVKDGEPVREVRIRTVLTCRCKNGICAKCYGANMATGDAVQVGEAIGIIAAQSIGEPGTQLTMRTFHTGGVAGSDITQGLPRVEELFEARKPKGLAIISEIDGEVSIREKKKESTIAAPGDPVEDENVISKDDIVKKEVIVTNSETGEAKSYLIPFGSRLQAEEGMHIEAGQEITQGSVDPHDLLRIKGVRAVQDYLLREVQRVYRHEGVEINDKHIEVIVHQMLKKVRIIESHDALDVLPGELMNVLDFDDMNDRLVSEGKEPAEGTQEMLGITKASLATDSFMSAASFQETTRVLTDAAIKGKVDKLIGMKENVIIGKLIPAGTGMKRYRNIDLNTDGPTLGDEIDFDEEIEISEEDEAPETVEAETEAGAEENAAEPEEVLVEE
ncbi:MAG: DNA-directed RNA polymerase subunit beta' [Lachnospiraceae bacterium]|nr:DNA-directed RNA polymerase subunit beta' [Lachnospiraceae bacterium]